MQVVLVAVFHACLLDQVQQPHFPDLLPFPAPVLQLVTGSRVSDSSYDGGSVSPFSAVSFCFIHFEGIFYVHRHLELKKYFPGVLSLYNRQIFCLVVDFC